MVQFDNVGVIFMARNIMSMSCTKHMDVRYKYVNECVEDSIVKIIFESADNDSDILTKNLNAELHEQHSKTMVVEKL